MRRRTLADRSREGGDACRCAPLVTRRKCFHGSGHTNSYGAQYERSKLTLRVQQACCRAVKTLLLSSTSLLNEQVGRLTAFVGAGCFFRSTESCRPVGMTGLLASAIRLALPLSRKSGIAHAHKTAQYSVVKERQSGCSSGGPTRASKSVDIHQRSLWL